MINQGICYAVPIKWWKQYNLIKHTANDTNFNSKTIPYASKAQILQLMLALSDNYRDPLIIEFQEDYITILAEKSHGLPFQRRLLSPCLLPDKNYQEDYCILSSAQFSEIEDPYLQKYPTILFALNKNNCIIYENQKVDVISDNFICLAGKRQFQIIFCTNRDSSIFIGYLPNNLRLIEALRFILAQLSLMQLQQTRIIFLQTQKQVAKSINLYQNTRIMDLRQQETFIMVTNLLSKFEALNQNQINPNDLQQCRSDKAVEGEKQFNIQKHTFDDRIIFDLQSINNNPNFGNNINNHKTISTGASTPALTFSHDSERPSNCNDFQIMMMFREKSKEQIDEMKKYGQSIIRDENNYIKIVKRKDEVKEVKQNEGVKMDIDDILVELRIISEQIVQQFENRKKSSDTGIINK